MYNHNSSAFTMGAQLSIVMCSIGKLNPAKSASDAAAMAAGGAAAALPVKRRSAEAAQEGEGVKKAVEDLVKPDDKDGEVKKTKKSETEAGDTHARRRRDAGQPIENTETDATNADDKYCLLDPSYRYKPLELTSESTLVLIDFSLHSKVNSLQ